jgi:hypothetical protein
MASYELRLGRAGLRLGLLLASADVLISYNIRNIRLSLNYTASHHTLHTAILLQLRSFHKSEYPNLNSGQISLNIAVAVSLTYSTSH